VTWRARHFGFWQELTVEITVFDRPTHFQDVMTRGVFALMSHDHRFEQRDGETTVMRDDFHFEAPFGVVGALASAAILTRYLRRFLVGRAAILKSTAESDAWRRYLQVSEPT
jgi:ligand-binding SRPBCC domain-containing protein